MLFFSKIMLKFMLFSQDYANHYAPIYAVLHIYSQMPFPAAFAVNQHSQCELVLSMIYRKKQYGAMSHFRLFVVSLQARQFESLAVHDGPRPVTL